MTNKYINDLFPQFFPIYWINEIGVFGIPFTEDVAIGFVKREHKSYSFLLKKDFIEQEFSQDLLLERSLENLDKISEGIQLLIAYPNNFHEITWQSENDNFSAIRLLLPRFQKAIIKYLGDKFLFIIPSRDIVTCWSINAPMEWTLKNYNDSEEIFKNDDYRLSPKIIIYDSIWPLSFYKIVTKD